jgi:hypothetical protein
MPKIFVMEQVIDPVQEFVFFQPICRIHRIRFIGYVFCPGFYG